MNKPCEVVLLAKFKVGDKHAFETVFNNNYKQLTGLAYPLLNDSFEAEDIVQQTFIDIWNKQLYRNIDTSIKAYLQRAVRNKCLNIITKKKVDQKLAKEYCYTESQPVYENDINTVEVFSLLVKKSLREFPPQRQAAFEYVYLKHKTYREAANEMGITVNSVKTHLKIGMKQLRSLVHNVENIN